MVYRYLEGQVFCTRCGYRPLSLTWNDVAGHARCNNCSTRVRMKPRSQRLKEIMRNVMSEREMLRINSQKTFVQGVPVFPIEFKL